MEKPINQRIKFLLETLSLSARDFSRAVGVPDNNTQNYLEPRFAQPKADYLEKVMLHFESINPSWLLTGKGEPFNKPLSATPSTPAAVKKNAAGVGLPSLQATSGVPTTLSDCKQQLAVLTAENEGLRSTVAALETALSAKEEILTLLRGGHTRPS